MASYFSIITNIVSFLTIIALCNVNQTLARHKNPNSSSSLFVFGLTHSSSSLPIPKSSRYLTKPSQPLDMMESLREVTDGYLISLNIGTPPQVIQVYMDTGSDLTWAPCGNLSFDCIDCDDYRNNKLMLVFSPSYSSSLVRDTCGSSFCFNIHSSDNHFDPCTMAGCSLSTLLKSTCFRPCPSFSYMYGGGGVVTGTLARDTLKIHGISNNSEVRDIARFCFGCIRTTYREPIGIAGFGRGALSLPYQLGFLQKGFSHCFLAFKYANNPNISSPLVLGDVAISSEDNLQFTPMLKSPILYPNYYYIGLEAITVGNYTTANEAPLNLKEFDSQGNGGMIIDSGTTYTHLPDPFYSQLLSTLGSMIPHPRATEFEMKTGFDLCYKVPCPNNTFRNDVFPPITFHFLNNVSLVLPQETCFYAMAAPSNSTGVKCLLFQIMNDGDYGPAGVFGSFQQQNVEVVYDLEKERIGFRPMDCASAAASQGLHKN
ncbi:hypothetical protein SLEP1_g51462 [Rubroshorea leprosula]|uniref:Peptidase A1 domain-containing protein n=1 Tax=Rubroshorea leprosula TaxID=152421 RepID=A0AAV5M422_9ROSI|nr:hypothetical protein SLEP1_g51462 [Rubroshorea leprosula]